MNSSSLRYRLFEWYTTWLVGFMLVTGLILYLGLRQYLVHQLSVTQLQRAERVDAVIKTWRESKDGKSLAEEIAMRFSPEARGWFLRVLSGDGTVLYQSGMPTDQRFDPAAVSVGGPTGRIQRENLPNGVTLILGTHQIKGGLRVEAGEALEPALEELRHLMTWLMCVAVAFTLIALMGAWRLVNRALRPVQEIAATAERISSQNLSERLPVPPQNDEITHLSLALNQMIERLEEAFLINRRFLGDASHELRTPLTILRGELETAVRNPKLDQPMAETLGNLLEEVERLVHLVESLLTLSRLDAGHAREDVARINFAALTASTADQMSLLADDKQVFVTCETKHPVWVEGDRSRLKQIVVNLLDNAIKYTPPGGKVTASVGFAEGQALLEVRDTGSGIPEEALPQIFERFFRVDKSRSRDLGGAGIGLSIVQAICQAHHGRAEVQSVVGRGSCFRIFLPAISPGPELHTIPHGS